MNLGKVRVLQKNIFITQEVFELTGKLENIILKVH